MLVPTTLTALLARRLIITRLGTPETISAGLIAGSAVLATANGTRGERQAGSATLVDAAAVGLAQSASLWPGVSRYAMAISGARAIGFDPGSAAELARCGLIPSALAGSAFETTKVLQDGRIGVDGPAMAAGFAAAFASTLASRGLVSILERGGSLLPFAVWRCCLALMAILRIRRLGDDASR
jgi:undecaprenyl-diphosphatase